MESVTNKELPHYGERLKVEIGYVTNIVNNFVYVDNKYYIIDPYKIDISLFRLKEKYMFFLTYYKSQWRIYYYIKL